MPTTTIAPLRNHAQSCSESAAVMEPSTGSGTYVSGDEGNRDNARAEQCYKTVCQHPNEVGNLDDDEILVVDFDNALFGDHAEVADLAMRVARNGVRVGIHTFHGHHPLLDPLAKFPNITIAKTHEEILKAMN